MKSQTTQIIRFFFNNLLGANCTTTWGQTPKSYRVSWLVYVLCDFMTMKTGRFSLPWIHHENTSCWYACFTFLVEAFLPSFCYILGICIYFSLYILLSQNCCQDQFLYLTYQEKCIIRSSRNISVIYYILFTLNLKKDMIHFSQTEFSVLILLILLLKNQEHRQKPYTTPFIDVQRITLGSNLYIKVYFLNQCHTAKLTNSEKLSKNCDFKL